MQPLLKGPPWLGPEKNFQIKGSQMAKNAIVRLVFANKLSHKRAALLSFELEFTESL